jgi:hypothetical protein
MIFFGCFKNVKSPEIIQKKSENTNPRWKIYKTTMHHIIFMQVPDRIVWDVAFWPACF